MQQQKSESINDFISRLRGKASRCPFTADDFNDRIIEAVIMSTPFEDFQKELLSKEKGYPITSVRGRQYEAIQTSQASI